MGSSEKPIKNEIVKQDSEEKTTYYYIDTERKIDIRSKEVFKKEDKFILYPFYQDKRSGEMRNKYKSIKSITFEGFGGTIPLGFIKSPTRGYGVTKTLKPLPRALSKFTMDNITISKKLKTQVSGTNLILNYQDFEKIRKKMAFILSVSSDRTRIILNNSLAQLLPSIFDLQKQKYKLETLNTFLSFCDVTRLSVSDKKILNELIERLALMNPKEEPEYLISTRETIERRFIEDILIQFDKHLKNKKTSEEKWQEFFSSHSWIFYQLLSHPTVLFKDKAYVGGKTISNADGKIVDFLYTNRLTRNSALIEIKTPEKRLLAAKPYRGSDVYSLSKELSGAISQVLDQKDSYTKEFNSLGVGTKVVSFNPKCIVLIGKIGSLNEKQQGSFELIRSSLKDVEIITFDELYERIDSILKIFKKD